MNKRINAVQALFFINNSVLVVKRKSGLYGFPSGKVEEGESIERAVIRELKEETGLEGIVLELIHSEYYDHKNQYVYKIALYPGFIKFEEDREAKFMKFDEFIKKSEFPEYNSRVLKKVNLI